MWLTSLPHRHFMTSMVRSEGSMTMKNNQEEIFDALTDFERRPSKEIPPVLEQFLRDVALTGETLFPWSRIKPLFKSKLEQVMTTFNEDSPTDHLPTFPNVENIKFEEYRRRIMTAVEKFHGVPFTIQRLCELITEPKKHYRRSDKFLRGIEKNVLVVSTVDPLGRREPMESKNLVNGLDTNGCSPKAGKSGDEDHAVPETHALVEVHSENISTKWPTAISAISVPSPGISSAPITTSSQATSEASSSPAQMAALSQPVEPSEEEAEEEAEAKTATNGVGADEEKEEVEDREAVSEEAGSQSLVSDEAMPETVSTSKTADLPSSNSEAEETLPAESRSHSDQDASITTSESVEEVVHPWPGCPLTVNNSAEASACSAAPSQAQATGPSSEVTISTSNSTSSSPDPEPLLDKSSEAGSESEATPASPHGEKEDLGQGDHAPECGQVPQQTCEVDSSNVAGTEDSDEPAPALDHDEPAPALDQSACAVSHSDSSDSSVAEVSVSSTELAEQSAQPPAELAEKEVEVPMEESCQVLESTDREEQQQPTQSEELPMEQD